MPSKTQVAQEEQKTLLASFSTLISQLIKKDNADAQELTEAKAQIVTLLGEDAVNAEIILAQNIEIQTLIEEATKATLSLTPTEQTTPAQIDPPHLSTVAPVNPGTLPGTLTPDATADSGTF